MYTKTSSPGRSSLLWAAIGLWNEASKRRGGVLKPSCSLSTTEDGRHPQLTFRDVFTWNKVVSQTLSRPSLPSDISPSQLYRRPFQSLSSSCNSTMKFSVTIFIALLSSVCAALEEAQEYVQPHVRHPARPLN